MTSMKRFQDDDVKTLADVGRSFGANIGGKPSYSIIGRDSFNTFAPLAC